MKESSGAPSVPVGAGSATDGMASQAGRKYQQELDAGEVISQTFSLLRKDYPKYLVVFLVVEGILGVVSMSVSNAYPVPTLSPTATPDQALAVLPGLVRAFLAILGVSLLASWLIGSVATAAAVKLASDEIEKGEASLRASLSFTASKLISIWAVVFLFGVVVILGFVALIVPGIILAIMFSLAIPAVISGNCGVLDSLGKSRELVAHRWLKTFAILLLFGIVLAVANVVATQVASLFGAWSMMASSLISAFYAPLVPIALTVYYYSNAARIAPPQALQAQPSGFGFCPSCGEPVAEMNQSFCRKCGNDLRPRQV